MSNLNTPKKYLKVLQDLKEELDKDPTASLTLFCIGRISGSAIIYLKNGGIIKSTGSKRYPYNVWDTIDPNLNMAKELLRRMRVKDKSTKIFVSDKIETPKPVETKIEKKVEKPVVPKIVKTENIKGIKITISGDLSKTNTITVFID